MSATNYILGNEFFVYDSSSNPIAYATTATLTTTAETISTANKQSGVWNSAMSGQISWNVSTSCLYTDAQGYDSMFNKMVDREPISIKFGRCISLGTAATDISTALDASKGYYEGTAYITNIELSAGNNEVASYSVEFTGNGRLEHKNS